MQVVTFYPYVTVDGMVLVDHIVPCTQKQSTCS